ncbi:MAG: cysteine desulfurase NifS [Saccharofermentans sp.]|jgi:cysteine desulfurase|nr:cysteine desulfurase NifS [Mageeibacillus sp.]MCI1264093.1 cysteine desulfurase NifS [Saccharofermentans sp.]MCI1274844.1 cysteine desulfurase NifS [Saccharofermentans sp.]MCI1768608.1 cysteine desulfurase NifS [Mageeibacillus sp.]
MNKLIYLDNAATTRVLPDISAAMSPYSEELFGNPASAYTFSGNINCKVDEARRVIADFIGAGPKEIFFTGGGSESDNWALKGLAFSLRDRGRHIITSKIEHHAVLHTCEFLEKIGYDITYLDVDSNGFISLDRLEKAIRPDTILISIMFANNEIGTIEPVKEIGRIAHEHGVLFHTDAVQAYGHVKIDVNDMNIDLLSVSGHKINGPKGIGFLYIRSGIRIEPLIHGGSQERGLRGGTTNVPGIIGLAKATEIAGAGLADRADYEIGLRDRLIDRIEKEIPYVLLNGDRRQRLPNNVSFCFRFIEGESLLILLDENGICASSGSACTSGSLDPSHVLLAIGRPHEIAHGSLRLTLSDETTKEDIDYTVDSLKKIITRLREMSPLYEDFIRKQEAAS